MHVLYTVIVKICTNVAVHMYACSVSGFPCLCFSPSRFFVYIPVDQKVVFGGYSFTFDGKFLIGCPIWGSTMASIYMHCFLAHFSCQHCYNTGSASLQNFGHIPLIVCNSAVRHSMSLISGSVCGISFPCTMVVDAIAYGANFAHCGILHYEGHTKPVCSAIVEDG